MFRIINLHRLTISFAMFAFVVLGSAVAARADNIVAYCSGNTCTVKGTNSQGLAIDATAAFTFGAGTIEVTLTNNLSPSAISSVNQAITGLFFTVSTGQSTGSLTDSSGYELYVDDNGSGYDGTSGVLTGWKLQTSPANTLNLCVICAGGNPLIGPAHAILGGNGLPTDYAAGGSIAGNKAHNPFLNGPVTFTLSVAGVTTDTTIGDVSIQFNTDLSPVTTIPEPASMLLFGTGLFGAVALARRLLGK